MHQNAKRNSQKKEKKKGEKKTRKKKHLSYFAISDDSCDAFFSARSLLCWEMRSAILRLAASDCASSCAYLHVRNDEEKTISKQH
jgi:hypothetical protein